VLYFLAMEMTSAGCASDHLRLRRPPSPHRTDVLNEPFQIIARSLGVLLGALDLC